MDEEREPLLCPICRLPFAYIVKAKTGWYIEIASRHHGESHKNIIPLVAPGGAPVDGQFNKLGV